VTGVSYSIAVQSPQYNLDTLQDLKNIPLTGTGGQPAPVASNGAGSPAMPVNAPMGGPPIQILGNVASVTPGSEQGTQSHYNIAPVIDIYGNVVNSDLASVNKGIEKIIADMNGKLPRGSRIVVRGQVETMRTSFVGLIGGLVFSILLVYLLIVVNFQSWLDPFIVISALPAALSGIVWFLFITHTRISVPALTGAIMCMGVATSNSILVISFAREQLEETVGDATGAALNAGFTRFRPVLMTALAMIIGMMPMALGLGDGGEQNAPLGRAVIGGLLFATISTLFFVPTFFSALHGRLEKKRRAKQNRLEHTLPETEEN
jgi:multidrug efflux pump subunit AcrB